MANEDTETTIPAIKPPIVGAGQFANHGIIEIHIAAIIKSLVIFSPFPCHLS